MCTHNVYVYMSMCHITHYDIIIVIVVSYVHIMKHIVYIHMYLSL